MSRMGLQFSWDFWDFFGIVGSFWGEGGSFEVLRIWGYFRISFGFPFFSDFLGKFGDLGDFCRIFEVLRTSEISLEFLEFLRILGFFGISLVFLGFRWD